MRKAEFDPSNMMAAYIDPNSGSVYDNSGEHLGQLSEGEDTIELEPLDVSPPTTPTKQPSQLPRWQQYYNSVIEGTRLPKINERGRRDRATKEALDTVNMALDSAGLTNKKERTLKAFRTIVDQHDAGSLQELRKMLSTPDHFMGQKPAPQREMPTPVKQRVQPTAVYQQLVKAVQQQYPDADVFEHRGIARRLKEMAGQVSDRYMSHPNANPRLLEQMVYQAARSLSREELEGLMGA